MTQTTITISTEDESVIDRLRAGIESNELIDLFGMKLAGVKLTVHAFGGEPRAFMIAQEVAVVKQEPALQWSGEGLPPVGTVCKVSAHHIHKSAWTEVQVLAHAKHEKDDALLVCEIECDGSKSTMHGVIYRSPAFRPIRTPAQIAADEREAAIEEMWKIYWQPSAPTAKQALGLLWDAGLRLPKGDAK